MTLDSAYGVLTFERKLQIELGGETFDAVFANRGYYGCPIDELRDVLATAGSPRLVSISADESPEETCVVWVTSDGELCTVNVADTAAFMLDKLAIGRGN